MVVSKHQTLLYKYKKRKLNYFVKIQEIQEIALKPEKGQALN